MAADRIRLVRADHVPDGLGAVELVFLTLTRRPGDLGGVAAPDDRRRRCAVTAQVLGALDGDQLLRCVDHRFRHHELLAVGIPGLRITLVAAGGLIAWGGSSWCGGSIRSACRGCRRWRAPRHALRPSPRLALAVPEEPWEQFQGVNHVSTFVRSGVTTGVRIEHQRLDRFRYRDVGPAARRRRRAVPLVRQAAEHHPGAR